MIHVTENCKGCGICTKECPLSSVTLREKKAVIEATCCECGICIRVCPFGALEKPASPAPSTVVCSSCPVQCRIPEGKTGACRRYENRQGSLIRNRDLVLNNPAWSEPERAITRPLITAVGAGTNYPCCRPAPFIVSAQKEGVDVVTVVTEAPLSYSGVTVKLDTNTYIGEEGDKVYRDGKVVGMVNIEEYGSKMIGIGGANRLTGKDGFIVARTIVDLANGEEVTLSVNKTTKVSVQMGKAPVINGVQEKKMRIGCGSATVGLFAQLMKDSVDEVIVIDHHVIGLVSEHLAGADVGMSWSGVVPNANKSSRGRYFGEHGDGIGGTTLKTPRDAIKGVDMSVAKAGMKILVVNTTGEIFALFQVLPNGDVEEIPMDSGASAVVEAINQNCQESLTSVMFVGGTGGSARGGVCRAPLALTKAVHEDRAVLTIGGAPAYVLPGGGINFVVDASKVATKAFTYVPTPAAVAPIEYTMRKSDYEAMKGHTERIVELDSLKR